MTDISKNIFNTLKIDDLPESVLSNINKNNFRSDTRKLIDLFNIKPTLSIDEIIIGLYRKHKIEKDRAWVISTLYNLSNKGVLKKLSKGIHEKVKNEEIENVR